MIHRPIINRRDYVDCTCGVFCGSMNDWHSHRADRSFIDPAALFNTVPISEEQHRFNLAVQGMNRVFRKIGDGFKPLADALAKIRPQVERDAIAILNRPVVPDRPVVRLDDVTNP